VIGQSIVRVLDNVCGLSGLRLGVTVQSKSERPPTYTPEFLKYSRESFDLTGKGSPSSSSEPDLIVHAATYGQPSKFELDKISTMKLNSTSLMRLLEIEPRRILFLSTSEIYSGLRGSVSESEVGTTNTNHPRAAYIESKRFGEAVTLASNTSSTTANVARIALAYGPGYQPDDERLLYSLVSRGLREKKVYLMDSGSALRTYCYVEDCADMLITILLRGRGEIYNVGGTDTVSVRGIGEVVANILGVPFSFPPVSVDAFTAGPAEVRLDISKTIDLSGKHDFIPLKQGVEKVVAYAREIGIG